MPKKKYSDREIDMLVEALGGPENAQALIDNKRLREALKADEPIGSSLERADKDIVEKIKRMTWREASELSTGTNKPAASQRKKGTRMTRAEVAELKEQILGCFEPDKWAGAADVAEHLGLDTKTVGTQMRNHEKEGKLRSKGKKTQKVYALLKS